MSPYDTSDCVCESFKWNKALMCVNLEGRTKVSYDGVEVADRFGAKNLVY